MCDPYETGTPKYSTAQHIYDSLCELVQTEEMGILSEIGVDVNYDNQTYYYTDKGYALKEKFEELSDFGNKMWLIDLAVTQVDRSEIHDTIFEALTNQDLAKRIGFKKLFVEKMLRGDSKDYTKIIEVFAYELYEEPGRCDQYTMIRVWNKVMEANGTPLFGVTPYPSLAFHVAEKVRRLELHKEVQFVVESRAHLSAYDDFLFGLRANQALFEMQEGSYGARVRELQAAYDQKVKLLMLAAEHAGLLQALADELNALRYEAAALPVVVAEGGVE